MQKTFSKNQLPVVNGHGLLNQNGHLYNTKGPSDFITAYNKNQDFHGLIDLIRYNPRQNYSIKMENDKNISFHVVFD